MPIVACVAGVIEGDEPTVARSYQTPSVDERGELRPVVRELVEQAHAARVPHERDDERRRRLRQGDLGQRAAVGRVEVEVQQARLRRRDVGERHRPVDPADRGDEPLAEPEQRHVLQVVPRTRVREVRADEVRLLRDEHDLPRALGVGPAPDAERAAGAGSRRRRRRGRPAPARRRTSGRSRPSTDGAGRRPSSGGSGSFVSPDEAVHAAAINASATTTAMRLMRGPRAGTAGRRMMLRGERRLEHRVAGLGRGHRDRPGSAVSAFVRPRIHSLTSSSVCPFCRSSRSFTKIWVGCTSCDDPRVVPVRVERSR